MLTARRFVTVVRFLVFKRPDRNRMYLKLHTLLRYYLPQPITHVDVTRISLSMQV
jgi:hypothetical protein